MAAPQITLYTGDVPNRATDSATEFANNADDMVNYLAVIPDEYNELADFVNGAAETAQASANFAGNWSSLSGAYDAGTGVYHDGITWLLLQYTASIQSYEPSASSSRWLALATLTQQATNTTNIATNTSDISANTSNITTNTSDISEIKSSNITLSGTKTFSSSPIVPTPTTDYQAATKKYVDDSFPYTTISNGNGVAHVYSDGFIRQFITTTSSTGQTAYSLPVTMTDSPVDWSVSYMNVGASNNTTGGVKHRYDSSTQSSINLYQSSDAISKVIIEGY